MSKSVGTAIFGLVLAFLGAGTSLNAETRSPAGKWVVDFDDAQCVAWRNYGTEQKPVLLVLKQPPIGDVMQIAVMRPSADRGGAAEQLDGSVTVDGVRFPASMAAFTDVANKRRVFVTNLPLDRFRRVAAGKTLTIRATPGLGERFELTALGALTKVMDDCVADLRTHWNFGEGANLSPKLKAAATGSLHGIVRPNDYPGIAIRRLEEGRLKFVLLIDETGNVADCTVVETSGVASLDVQVCATIRERANFTPAVGLDGKPAKHYFVQRFTWEIR